jgi:hypothetical protein
MDIFEQIADEATISVAVLTNQDLSEIRLLNLSPVGCGGPEKIFQLFEIWRPEGFQWLGVVGAVRGQIRHAFTCELNALCLDTITRAFREHCVSLVPAKGDSLEFLERLYALQDPRS